MFKIPNFIMVSTNTFLYKIKYIESNICEFCRLLIQDKGEHPKLDTQTVLFGILNSKGNKTTFANWIIINVKYYVPVCKQNAKQKTPPSIYALLNIIKDTIHIKKYILYKNCQFKEYEKYWAPWSGFLEPKNVNILT